MLCCCAALLSTRLHCGQTFIRNAIGRALQDSPALNANSRAVLVPLTQQELPRIITVPGPGPAETHRQEPALPSVPTPPKPTAVAPRPSQPVPTAPEATAHTSEGSVDGNSKERDGE